MTALESTTGISAIPPRPRTWPQRLAIFLAVATFTAATCAPAIGGLELDPGALIRNWQHGATKIAELIRPDFGFFPRTLKPMLETLQIALVGAVFAALCSVPLTLWATRTTNPNRGAHQAVRTVINIVRAVPDLVYATVLVALVGVGALPGLLTVFLFDLGIVVKLVSEAIDASEHGYLEAGKAAGGKTTAINRMIALPQNWALFANQWLYSLELNVRISAVLGIVGAGGIGRLINERFGFYAYDDIGLIILEILVVIIVIELCSNYLRRKLTRV